MDNRVYKPLTIKIPKDKTIGAELTVGEYHVSGIMNFTLEYSGDGCPVLNIRCIVEEANISTLDASEE